MEITVPADDAASVVDPPPRYEARLVDGSVVWTDTSALDCILMARTYWQLYGFTVTVEDLQEGTLSVIREDWGD